MFMLAVKHQVADYATWKAVYDAFPPTKGGAKFARVNRSTDDANDVLVVAGFATVADAKGFMSNAEFGAAMKKAGVTSAPRFELYEQVEATG